MSHPTSHVILNQVLNLIQDLMISGSGTNDFGISVLDLENLGSKAPLCGGFFILKLRFLHV